MQFLVYLNNLKLRKMLVFSPLSSTHKTQVRVFLEKLGGGLEGEMRERKPWKIEA
jgi:hypothetical protein